MIMILEDWVIRDKRSDTGINFVFSPDGDTQYKYKEEYNKILLLGTVTGGWTNIFHNQGREERKEENNTQLCANPLVQTS